MEWGESKSLPHEADQPGEIKLSRESSIFFPLFVHPGGGWFGCARVRRRRRGATLVVCGRDCTRRQHATGDTGWTLRRGASARRSVG